MTTRSHYKIFFSTYMSTHRGHTEDSNRLVVKIVKVKVVNVKVVKVKLDGEGKDWQKLIEKVEREKAKK